jgi:hypothetical protein
MERRAGRYAGGRMGMYHSKLKGTWKMAGSLSKTDEELIRELLAWDSWRRPREWLLCNIALVVGGILIVGAAAFALPRLNDRVIMGLLVPGFVMGLFFVGLYVFGSRRIRERHRVAELLRRVTPGI